MYHIGDLVVYGAEGVCEIKELTEVRFGKETNEYFILEPVTKRGDVFYVPTSSEQVLSRIRPILSVEDAKALVAKPAPELPKWNNNERERVARFKQILVFGTTEDVMNMMREIYAHKIVQTEKGKRLHSCDERIMKDAEYMLFDELAYVLGVPQTEVINLIAAKGTY